MTAETAQSLADAFREHREAFGVSMTIAGTAIVAVVNQAPFGRELMDGGFADEGEVDAKVLLSDLPTLPSIGTAAVFAGRSLRVARVNIRTGGLIGELTLRPSKR